MAKIAIISFTNYPKGQNRACMKTVMDYTMQEKKTRWQGQSLIGGVNCRPESVYDDFLSTKLLYHKDDGTLFFHMVQSHPKGADVDPVTAHAAAMKLAESFPGREVLVCTHIDREHIHSHLIINSVSLDDGRKLHIAEPDLVELRQRNDAVCMEFGLPVFQQGQKKKQVKSMSTAEYHAAARGESWKFRLMNTIDDCMQYAHTKDEFITLMRSEGYDVRWEKKRQSITYTIPSGYQCRDDRLHDEKYLKEAMEHEFGIRQRIIHGRIETAEPSAAEYSGGIVAPDANIGTAPDAGGMERSAGETQCAVPRNGGADGGFAAAIRQGTPVPADGAADGTGAGNSGDTSDPRTGWEKERAALFAAPAQNQTAAPVPGAAVDPGDPAGIMGSVVELGHAVELAENDVPPVNDATAIQPHIDSKRQRKLQEKKIAAGHKPSGHEDEELTMRQTMY